MCLLVFSQTADGLVLVANRDESYDRPTAALNYWSDAPDILAGRDLLAGGTWLGATRGGRVVAITNFRKPGPPAGTASRGQIAADFLRSSEPVERFLCQLAARADHYPGFNVVAGVAGSRARFFYFSNAAEVVRELAPGSYGLSNHLLDTPWPKVVAAKARLSAALARGERSAATLCDLLLDRGVPKDAELPDTGIGRDRERQLAASFIVTPDYGTRSTTALVIRASGRAEMFEKSYGRGGRLLGEAGYEFDLGV